MRLELYLQTQVYRMRAFLVGTSHLEPIFNTLWVAHGYTYSSRATASTCADYCKNLKTGTVLKQKLSRWTHERKLLITPFFRSVIKPYYLILNAEKIKLCCSQHQQKHLFMSLRGLNKILGARSIYQKWNFYFYYHVVTIFKRIFSCLYLAQKA